MGASVHPCMGRFSVKVLHPPWAPNTSGTCTVPAAKLTWGLLRINQFPLCQLSLVVVVHADAVEMIKVPPRCRPGGLAGR